MLYLLLLASISPALSSVDSAAPEANDQMVRAEKNGEFLWKYYPPGAAKRGEQGRVAFRLTIEPTGVISTCDVTESSGFKALDAETCEIMGQYARVQPMRNPDGRAIRAQTTGYIVWKLPSGSTQVASASTSKTMPKPDQMICRKDVTTGSLIATTRQCMTRSEWARTRSDTQNHWENLQGKGYTNGDGVIYSPGQ